MKLFLSHSTPDDDLVRRLRLALVEHGQDIWIDSRELRGGVPLWPEIQRAIEAASAFAVVVSAAALQSEWVSRELQYALKIQEKRGGWRAFPVISLLFDGTRLGALAGYFAQEAITLSVESTPGGVEAAVDRMLVALGVRQPADVGRSRQPEPEALEDLVLELDNLRIDQRDGSRRASASARLVYQPATPGQRAVESDRRWRLSAPLGPIEAEDLLWYLEKYAIWPSGVDSIQKRAREVEANLVRWGRLLHEAAFPVAHTANVMQAWAKIDRRARRRFSVYVDATLEAGAESNESEAARQAATLLLGLPWELLHDGSRYLFQGAQPTRVRRRLPNTRALDVAVVKPPIRILLLSARPEDDACGYLDHRASAEPLVAAMEALPGLVDLRLLDPPTLPALRQELERAQAADQPYHVLHFDGHGVYDRRVGLGGLCFEHPADVERLEKRRHVTVYTDELGALLSDQRIPLVFLEACQSAQAESAAESVASELLKVGVASVVAMSHSVLVESARRFVQAFYQALAAGKRVGDAMLAGQCRLRDDPGRGRVFGAAELRLEDWFVPVLYQEEADPQLFTRTPAPQTVADEQAARARRLGDLPPPPATGFVGRSRELLALQRLLRQERYAVVRGQGGEGKTALAGEFARWLLRSQQVQRVAFVSLEGLENNLLPALIDALGRQLIKAGFAATADCAGDLERAQREIERALREQSTLLVLDNLESVLLPPYLAQATPVALGEELQHALRDLLTLCARFNAVGETRLLFTSREALPAPFAGQRQRRELQRLATDDAVKLVERALDVGDGGDGGALGDTMREAIERLVDTVHGHARTLALLALLAPALRERGVERTQATLVELLAEMERRFPGQREQSLYASVELSLRRLSAGNRQRARALGVFHGGVDLDMLRVMMDWQPAEVASLAGELVASGLATANPYDHLAFNPALCPYLRARLDDAERDELNRRWRVAMREYVAFLYQQQFRDAQLAATLAGLELPNLLVLLESVQSEGNAEATIELATSLYSLLQNAGRPRLLECIGQVRDAAAQTLGEIWNHARFEATRTRIEQQLAGDQLRAALVGAQAFLERARAAGEQAYPGADYDLAGACWLLTHMLQFAGQAQPALSLLDEARQRFEALEAREPGCGAEGMALACLSDTGNCLRALGRLDDAATAYEAAIAGNERRGARRDVAVGKFQLGIVRLRQRRYDDALAACEAACAHFADIGEPSNVAGVWHQIGVTHQDAGRPEAAEEAFRQSLAIEGRQRNLARQARTLAQLGLLYADKLNRLEDAVACLRQALEMSVDSGDLATEGRIRSNLAMALRRLGRLDEARSEIRRAITRNEPFGHAAEPWKSWAILTEIEHDADDALAMAKARGFSLAAFVAYRRDGGENHTAAGRLAFSVGELLCGGKTGEAAKMLQQFAADPNIPETTLRKRRFIPASPTAPDMPML